MIYVCVECPKCGQENEVDETLKSFYCLKCGAKCDLEYESIYEPDDDAPKAPMTASDEEAGKRLKRATLFLEDEDWARAWAYCESVLDYDPENAEAYLTELLVTFRLHSANELKTCKRNYKDHPLFKKAYRFADEDYRLLLGEIQSYEKNLDKYERAVRLMQGAENAKTPGARKGMLQKAANQFDSLGSFEDSRELAEKCRQLKESV